MAMQKKMAELGLSINDVASSAGHAYDHIRKVYNGDTFPGPYLLPSLCKTLKLDVNDMRKKVMADKALEKGWESAISGKDKRLLLLERYWASLKDSDKEELIAIARMKANASA
jgi:hypothetical protein